MLRTLNIRNILIIDHLELDFQTGLNVLTGETGAGKSILLDALGFVLGWRTPSDLIRKGADQGDVNAVFEIPTNHPVRTILRAAGLLDDSDLIIRRTITSDKRKTTWINDTRVSTQILKSVSETLVELHGQHDDRGLLNAKGHRLFLDAYARIDLSTIKTLWADMRQASAALSKARLDMENAQKEEDFLRHALEEFTNLAPQAGEDNTLDTRRRLMQASEKIQDDLKHAALALGIDGAEKNLSDALRYLETLSARTEGDDIGAALNVSLMAVSRTFSELSEAQSGLETLIEATSFNIHELEQTEERLFALRALARKHNLSPDDLESFGKTLQDKLDALAAGNTHIEQLETQKDQATQAYNTHAQTLNHRRKTAATKLDKAVIAELAPLKMERAIFKTDITPAPDGPEGKDTITFTITTNPDTPTGPLNKVASGGELSRLLLALKVCLAPKDQGNTLIFDEIDRGIGGATANAVGQRLHQLAAQEGQVIVITHSPQVAALGAHHWQVAKHVNADNMTICNVTHLSDDRRIEEIARMISGDTITPAACEAAKALLDNT